MNSYKGINKLLVLLEIIIIILGYVWLKDLGKIQMSMEMIKDIKVIRPRELSPDMGNTLGKFTYESGLQLDSITAVNGKIEISGIYNGDIDKVFSMVDELKRDGHWILKKFRFENNQCSFSFVCYDENVNE